MEHSNLFFLLHPDCNEQQPKMNPSAWLLKVAIVRIELQQEDPTICIRCLSPDHVDFQLWCDIRNFFTANSISSGDRLCLAFEIGALDTLTLFTVMCRVEMNDNLRKMFYQALRSIRHAIIHAGSSYPNAYCIPMRVINRFFQRLAAYEPRFTQEYVDASESDSELAIAYTIHTFLTSVLHLLTSVFRYRIGYVDRGGSKTYSFGAFDFRASFVSLVLFQGAYVKYAPQVPTRSSSDTIKFRQAARPGSRKRKAPHVGHEVVDIETCNLKGVYARSFKEKSSGAIIRFKYKPRFTLPRRKRDDGNGSCSKRLPLGEYHTPTEAQIVLQIAQYHDDKDGGCVKLKNGRYKFPIPPMSEQERGLAGKEKRTAKQIYDDFQREKGKHLAMATEVGSDGTESNDPSSSAPPLACSSLPMLTAMVDEPAIGSAAPSSLSLPLLPFDGAIVGDVDDSCEALSRHEDMIAKLLQDLGLPNLPDQQLSVVSYQMQSQGFAQLPGDPSLPEVGGVAVDTDYDSELELNSSPSFQQGRDLADAVTENIDSRRVFFQQNVPDLQQLVLCQEKCLEDNARQFVDLDHQLKACQIQKSRLEHEYQIQILKLQQEKEQLRSENESLKSRLEQVVKSQVAILTGIMIDI